MCSGWSGVWPISVFCCIACGLAVSLEIASAVVFRPVGTSAAILKPAFLRPQLFPWATNSDVVPRGNIANPIATIGELDDTKALSNLPGEAGCSPPTASPRHLRRLYDGQACQPAARRFSFFRIGQAVSYADLFRFSGVMWPLSAGLTFFDCKSAGLSAAFCLAVHQPDRPRTASVF